MQPRAELARRRSLALALLAIPLAPLPATAQDCSISGEKWDDIQLFRRCLAERGLDAWDDSPTGRTVLHNAALQTSNPTIIRLLLDAGADPNTPDDRGVTPLHLGAQNRNPMVVTHLLSAGADLHTGDNEGYTPLHHAAAWSGNDRVVNLLLTRGANPLADSNDGRTPLHSALRYQAGSGTVTVLIEAGAAASLTPLQRAALDGDDTTVESLLADGADPDAADRYGWGPLHYAVPFGGPDVVTLLLRAGADPGVIDEDQKRTPLHYAAVSSTDPAVVVTLVNAGVDPGIRDDQGQLAVDLARANDAIIGTEAYPLLVVGEPEPLTPGRASTGRIEPTDRVRWGHAYYEEWALSAISGQRVVVTMESDDFDPYLIVLSDDGMEIASDDDGGDGLNARLEFRAPATGRYTILATTAAAGQAGRYGIRLEAGGVGSSEGRSIGWTPDSSDGGSCATEYVRGKQQGECK